MSNWNKEKLGDYSLKIGSGSTPRGGASVYMDSGEIALIRSQNIYNDQFSSSGIVYIDDKAAKKLQNVEVLENDILLNITGDSVARCCLVNKDFLPARVNQHVAIIRPDSAEYDPYFVRYYLVSPEMQNELLVLASSGATRNALTKGMIENLDIPKPEINTQRKIGNILKAFDDKIENNRRMNETLEAMAQAIFKSWFVDFDPVHAKANALKNGGNEADARHAAMQAISGKTFDKPEAMQATQPEAYAELATTADAFPACFVDSALGLIPEGWEVKSIAEIVTRLSVRKRYTKNQVKQYGATPVFEQGSSILLGFHDEKPQIEASTFKPKFIFGDHTCITYLSCKDFDISQNVIPLEGKGKPTIWVYYAIQGKQTFQEYRRHWSEFIVKNVCIAPDKLCLRYGDLVTQLYLKKEQLILENNMLAQTRDALLPKLLSGEIDVSTLIPSVEEKALAL